MVAPGDGLVASAAVMRGKRQPSTSAPVGGAPGVCAGSTASRLPTADGQVVQVWLTQERPPSPQSLLLQQVPPTQTLPQQRSAGLAAQAAPLLAQALETHFPVVGLQMLAAPS